MGDIRRDPRLETIVWLAFVIRSEESSAILGIVKMIDGENLRGQALAVKMLVRSDILAACTGN